MDMFQKLEKVLKRIHRTRKNNLFLIQFIFFFDVLFAQIDQRFDLYDWEIIRQNESINSRSCSCLHFIQCGSSVVDNKYVWIHVLHASYSQ